MARSTQLGKDIFDVGNGVKVLQTLEKFSGNLAVLVQENRRHNRPVSTMSPTGADPLFDSMVASNVLDKMSFPFILRGVMTI